MKKTIILILLLATIVHTKAVSQTSGDSIVLKDIEWDNSSPAGMMELKIPSGGSLLQGIMYKANGGQQHPTLIMLHGYPGNEKNLDLAQVVRAHGWNVIYFNYRGSWGSQGQFSFNHCVEDAVNVVAWCKNNRGRLQIDTSNIVLFGHSMGGWVCLKALQQLPTIKKGFVLSAWNISDDFKDTKPELRMHAIDSLESENFVLNTPVRKIFEPVVKNITLYDLKNDSAALAGKQIVMLDEHHLNKQIARGIQNSNRSYFDYEVWNTDHPFTNKRIALMKKVLNFLDK